MCSPRACASKPPFGSCRSSSSVVNFRCSVTRRFASLGAQACHVAPQSMRVACETLVTFALSPYVLSRFGSALSLFSLLVVSVCRMPFLFCFFFGSNRFYTRRCFVYLEMYSHCRCVPALRGQSLWDVRDARRTPKNAAVMLVALCFSSGFPLRRGEALRVLGLPHRRSCFSSLDTSDVLCQVSCWEREICPVFFCSWSGHDVCAGQVFGDRPAGVLRRPRAKQPSLGVSGTEGSGRWGRRHCLLSLLVVFVEEWLPSGSQCCSLSM